MAKVKTDPSGRRFVDIDEVVETRLAKIKSESAVDAEAKARRMAEAIIPHGIGDTPARRAFVNAATKYIASALTESRTELIKLIEDYGRRCFVMSQEMSLSEADRKDFRFREKTANEILSLLKGGKNG